MRKKTKLTTLAGIELGLKPFNVTWKETNKKYNQVERVTLVEAKDRLHAENLVHQAYGSFHLDKSKDQRFPVYVPSDKVTILKVRKARVE